MGMAISADGTFYLSDLWWLKFMEVAVIVTACLDKSSIELYFFFFPRLIAYDRQERSLRHQTLLHQPV